MIKYKCRYMYDEWNCMVECLEKKTEYTVLQFHSQYFNTKMHIGSNDNEFWCFFPEYNKFTELLSPIDLYKNIDILSELFENPYEIMMIAKGIKKYLETQLEEDTVEIHIEKLKGHVYTNKVKVVLYDEERDVYHLIYKINRSKNECMMASYRGTSPNNYEVCLPFIDSLDHHFGHCRILNDHKYLNKDIHDIERIFLNKFKNEVVS